MAKINLRPWREERAAARQKDFVTNLLASGLFAAVLVFLAGYYLDIQTDRQSTRNQFLQTKISELDARIKEIEELKRQRERLLERLNAIQELQGNRPIIVRNFDELVRVLPDGVHYTLLERRENGFDDNKAATSKKDSLKITGLALQNKDVSDLMRNLHDSIWFEEPDLSKVGAIDNKKKEQAQPVAGANVRVFDLSVALSKPKAEDAK